VHAREPVTGEHLRITVRLDLELAELGRVVAVAQPLEQLQDATGRPPGSSIQEHLLLGADPANAVIEAILRDHPLEGAQVREDSRS